MDTAPVQRLLPACNATHAIAKAFLSVRPSVYLANACVVTQRKKLPIFLCHMREHFILVFQHEQWLVVDDPFVPKIWAKLTQFEQKRRFSIDIRSQCLSCNS